MRKTADTRVPLLSAIAERWSPRAFDPDAEVTSHQLATLLEAARWAPSFGNTQPARYLVGCRGDATFKRIFTALSDGNQGWARRAGALLVGVMVTANEKGDVPYAEYGLGLATENLVLQAVESGLIAHQMAGFSAEAVRESFALPDGVVPRVVIAVGHATDASVLEDERSVEREHKPRQRIPLNEFAFSGEWGTPALDE
ncbi:MAG TPA: nitroreductase family protein [Amycolatopsis sp.]|nr:nitroreductase family protein [Amycolatopsis sp.]